LTAGTVTSFFISEITSMEIHSVLGKYRRGSPRQRQACNRKILVAHAHGVCSNTWTSLEVKRMKPKVFRDIRKLISDIEHQRGDIQATVLPLDANAISHARRLLMEKADRYRFGSHDALIAGVAISLDRAGTRLTVVTSDRGMKAILGEEGIPFYDPK
jgi:hypothetical protein